MSLYDDLGVAADATAAQILTAHRKLVKQHHPDQGGDRAAFERVQRAFEVLSDPERRARYDTTGDDAEPKQNAVNEIRARALSIVAALVAQYVDDPTGADPHVDLRAQMLTALRDGGQQMKREAASIEARIARVDALAKRWAFKGKGDDVIASMLRGKRQSLENDRTGCANAMKINDEAIVILNDYLCAFTPHPQRGLAQQAASAAFERYGYSDISAQMRAQRPRGNPFGY